MAARKSTTRKKSPAKTPKKNTARKKKAAPKKTATRKKTSRKKTAPKTGLAGLATRTQKAINSNLRDLERELPKHLKSLIGDIRKGVIELESQIDQVRKDGEARWNDLEKNVRRDSDRMLDRFGLGTAKKKPTKRKAAKASRSTRKSTHKKGAR